MTKNGQRDQTPKGDTSLQKAITAYRNTGSRQPLLEHLGVLGSERILLALQTRLSKATSRQERDAIEDLAFDCASDTAEIDGTIRKVKTAFVDAFGEIALKYVDIAAIVRGISFRAAVMPPVNLITAAAGIEAEMAVANSIRIPEIHAGSTLTMTKSNCPQCKGQSDGDDCKCHILFEVPDPMRDGEVVCGTYVVSGADRDVCIRVEMSK